MEQRAGWGLDWPPFVENLISVDLFSQAVCVGFCRSWSLSSCFFHLCSLLYFLDWSSSCEIIGSGTGLWAYFVGKVNTGNKYLLGCLATRFKHYKSRVWDIQRKSFKIRWNWVNYMHTTYNECFCVCTFLIIGRWLVIKVFQRYWTGNSNLTGIHCFFMMRLIRINSFDVLVRFASCQWCEV